MMPALVLLTLFSQDIHAPKNPTSPAEADRVEARRLYGLGLLLERKSRLLEALRAFEAAAKLDPDAVSVRRALVPLYLALDRLDDGVATGRAVMKADPEDFHTGYALGRQLRVANRPTEAIEFLTLAAKAEALDARLDVASLLLFDLGCLLEQDGKLAEAEAALKKVVAIMAKPAVLVELTGAPAEEIRAQAAEVHERLGQVLLKRKKIDAGREAFDAARRLDPARAPRLSFDLARVFRDAGRPADALSQLEAYLGSLPSGVEAYEMKIALQRELGKSSDVLPDLEAASERDANNVPLRLLFAAELRKAKRATRAEAVYVELLGKQATPEVYAGLFGLYKGQASGPAKVLRRLDAAIRAAVERKGEPGDAAQAANARAMLTVLRGEPGLVKALLTEALTALAPGRLDFTTKITLGTLAGRTNELATAEKLYRACLDAEDLGGAEAELYSGLLQVLQLAHKNADVIELATRGLKKAQATNHVLFHRAMAYAHLALGKPKEAMAAAEAAVTASGKEQLLGSRKLKAHVLCETGKGEQALEECKALVKDYNYGGELREARLALSRTYQALGRHDESEAELDRILEADPNDATVCNDLGYGLADRGKDLQRAETLIRKALELDRKQRASGPGVDVDAGEDNASFADSLGWVLFRRGKLDEARRELERAAASQQGEDPVIFDHLGDVYFKLGLPAKAKESWAKAVALYERGARPATEPRFVEIREKLKGLKP